MKSVFFSLHNVLVPTIHHTSCCELNREKATIESSVCFPITTVPVVMEMEIKKNVPKAQSLGVYVLS